MTTSRRDFIVGTGAAIAVANLPATRPATAERCSRAKLLAEFAEELLVDYPESATEPGHRQGPRAALKAKLVRPLGGGAEGHRAARREAARAPEGHRYVSALGEAARIDVDVMRTAHEFAAEGFAFPYGDVGAAQSRAGRIATRRTSSRRTPARSSKYRACWTSSTPCETREDADAYLARLEAYAGQLDGETGRLKAAAAQDVIAPDFLLDKTLTQIKIARGGKIADWSLVHLAREADERQCRATTPRKAAKIAADKIAPALDRQIAELEAHRRRATGDAGVWKLPRGDEYYAWALRAATTTRMTPEQIHERGQEELRALQSEMDAILKRQGLTQGTVGERMTALGKQQRFRFADSDAGRAQLMAYLDDRVRDMRTRLPRAFATLVPGKPRDQAHGAGGGAGRAGRLRRPGHDRRQGAGQVLDQPAHDERLDDLQPADAHLSRVHSRPRLAGRVHVQVAAVPLAARVQRLSRKAGRCTPSSSPTSSASTTTIRSVAWAICSRSPSAPADSSSTPACMRSAGRASRRFSGSPPPTARASRK